MNPVVVHKIRTLIQDNNFSEDFSEIIKSTDDYDAFYHLGDIRRGIISWYPFKKDSRILEVHAELGAVTGALSDAARQVVSIVSSAEEKEVVSVRYGRRNNVTCICRDELCAYERKSFDYIVYLGGLEKFYTEDGKLDGVVRHLTELKGYLKDDGVFLLAVENRYGIDNWIGKRDSFTGIPFDALNNYAFGTVARAFTKAEIESIAKMSGFSTYKFYYPVSDYKAPRAIYTDAMLPQENINERLDTVYEDTDTLVATNNHLYKDIIKAGCFTFFANSYLVEMTNGNSLSSAQYVTVSSFRGRKKAFSVVVDAASVYKKCLFPEGHDYALRLCKEAEELRNRGIPVVSMTMNGNGFVMPFINAPTLQLHIMDLVKKQERDQIIRLFDRLWEYILQSSDYADECAFDTGNIQVGIILKKAFIELIPLNCFYINGDLLFYDQEFSKSNYPARYVMARAIRNSYAFIQGLDALIPREDCCARYGMDTNQWNLFRTIDDDWVSKVNSYQFSHAAPSPDIIKRNQLLLHNSKNIHVPVV